MKNKEIKKLEWNIIIIYLIRLLFIIAFFEPPVIWFIHHTQHTHIHAKFINMLTAAIGFSLTFIPQAVEKLSKSKLKFSASFSFVIVLFIFGAEFLGELNNFYDQFPWWDIMLHTMSGIILGLIGFMLIFVLNESSKTDVKLSPLFICVFAFCFALSCGALWEIFEFSGDRLFHLNMQKYLPPDGVTTIFAKGWRYDAGLIDTMTDIICDASSAFVTSLTGFIALKMYARKKGKKTSNMVSEKEFMDALTHGKDLFTKL